MDLSTGRLPNYRKSFGVSRMIRIDVTEDLTYSQGKRSPIPDACGSEYHGGERMIDLKKLSALEKAAKRGPWYAWLKPVHTPDKCITTVPAEQFLREYKEAEKFNAELSERIGHAAVSDEWKNRYLTYDEEVIGCSEWLHAENADLLLIVEMRNQLPDLIAYINRLVAEIERLREKVHQRADRIAELEAEVKRLSQPNACDDWGNPVVLGVSGGVNEP